MGNAGSTPGGGDPNGPETPGAIFPSKGNNVLSDGAGAYYSGSGGPQGGVASYHVGRSGLGLPRSTLFSKKSHNYNKLDLNYQAGGNQRLDERQTYLNNDISQRLRGADKKSTLPLIPPAYIENDGSPASTLRLLARSYDKCLERPGLLPSVNATCSRKLESLENENDLKVLSLCKQDPNSAAHLTNTVSALRGAFKMIQADFLYNGQGGENDAMVERPTFGKNQLVTRQMGSFSTGFDTNGKEQSAFTGAEVSVDNKPASKKKRVMKMRSAAPKTPNASAVEKALLIMKSFGAPTKENGQLSFSLTSETPTNQGIHNPLMLPAGTTSVLSANSDQGHSGLTTFDRNFQRANPRLISEKLATLFRGLPLSMMMFNYLTEVGVYQLLSQLGTDGSQPSAEVDMLARFMTMFLKEAMMSKQGIKNAVQVLSKVDVIPDPDTIQAAADSINEMADQMQLADETPDIDGVIQQFIAAIPTPTPSPEFGSLYPSLYDESFVPPRPSFARTEDSDAAAGVQTAVENLRNAISETPMPVEMIDVATATAVILTARIRPFNSIMGDSEKANLRDMVSRAAVEPDMANAEKSRAGAQRDVQPWYQDLIDRERELRDQVKSQQNEITQLASESRRLESYAEQMELGLAERVEEGVANAIGERERALETGRENVRAFLEEKTEEINARAAAVREQEEMLAEREREGLSQRFNERASAPSQEEILYNTHLAMDRMGNYYLANFPDAIPRNDAIMFERVFTPLGQINLIEAIKFIQQGGEPVTDAFKQYLDDIWNNQTDRSAFGTTTLIQYLQSRYFSTIYPYEQEGTRRGRRNR